MKGKGKSPKSVCFSCEACIYLKKRLSLTAPAASAAQSKPISLSSLREQLPISCPKEKKKSPWSLTQMSVKLNIPSVLSLKNLEKFPSFLKCSTSRALSNTVKSFWVGSCFSEFPGSIDTHHCSSSPSFPLHPHSHMTNFFHSIIRTATQLLHPTHYLALLFPFCHIAQQPKDRNW